MNTAKFKKYLALLLISVMGFIQTVEAATVTLATAPIANQAPSVVHPNVMFVLDNSGSMAWNYLPDYISSGSGGTGSSICWNGTNPSTVGIISDSDSRKTCAGAGSSGTDVAVPFASSDINYIYYNPKIVYKAPVKADATSYANSTPSAANTDGFAATGSVNLGTTTSKTATAAAGSTSVTLSNTTSLAVGMTVSGTGVAPGTFLATTSNPVTFSKPVTAALTGAASTVTFASGNYQHQIFCSVGSPSTLQKYSAWGNTDATAKTRNGTFTNSSASVTIVGGTSDLFVGMAVAESSSGAHFPVGYYIAAIPDSTHITLSNSAGTVAGTVALTFTPTCMENGDTSSNNLYPLNTYTNVNTYSGTPFYYTMSPMEYCKDSVLSECKPSADSTHSVPAPYRWCNNYNATNHRFDNSYSNNGVLTNNCQDLRDQTHTIPDYLGGVSAGSVAGVKATADLIVNSYNPGLKINDITIGGTSVVPAGVITAGGVDGTDVISLANTICTKINLLGTHYTCPATPTTGTLTIVYDTAGTSPNGQQVVVSGPPTNLGQQSVGSITVTDAAVGKKIDQITINGNNLLTTTLTGTGVTATTAQNICNAINAGPSKTIYKARNGSPAPAFGTCTGTNNVIEIRRITSDAVDNGQAVVLTPASGTPAVAATGTITINAQAPGGSGTQIENVTFNGTSILPTSPIRFAGVMTPGQIADQLSAALSTPAGFNKTHVAGSNLIKFSASSPPGATPTIVVTAVGQAAASATATITVGGNSVSNHADLSGLTAGVAATNITGHLDQTQITNDNSTNSANNAIIVKNAIIAASGTTGYSATSTGSTVTVIAPTGTSHNGETLTKPAATPGVPSTGVAATGSITLGAQPGGAQTDIEEVLFNGSSILPTKPIKFAAGTASTAVASALSTALSNPTGWTHAVSPAGSSTIVFTQSTLGGAAPTIAVTNAGLVAISPTATITVGGNASASNPADLGFVKAGTTTIVGPHYSIANDASSNATPNANLITTAINTSGTGYTAAQSGSVVTVVAPAGIAHNGELLTKSAASGGGVNDNAVTGVQAKGSITLSSQAGQTEIDDVTFNGASILLTKPLKFTVGTNTTGNATTLSGQLSNPTGWTHAVSGSTVTFTQTANGGTAPTIVVSGAGIAAKPATSTITVGGNATLNKGVLGGIKAGGATTIANAIPSTTLTSVNTANINSNASAVAAAISLAGYSASPAGSLVTVSAPPGLAGNGPVLSFVAGTPTPAGTPATGTITISSATGQTSIESVTVAGSANLLAAPVKFLTTDTTVAQRATKLSTALSNPTGWTHAVSGGVITFTATTNGGSVPSIVVTSAGLPAVSATSTITVGGDATSNKGVLGGIKAGSTIIANAIGSATLTSVNSTNSAANAAAIDAAIALAGYTANATGSTVTVIAPAGAAANGTTLSFVAGTPVSGTAPAGSFSITNATTNSKTISSIMCGVQTINTSNISTGSTCTSTNTTANATCRIGKLLTNLNTAGNWANSYSYSCAAQSGSTDPKPTLCTVTGPVGPAACANLSITKDASITLSSTTPAFSGGSVATVNFGTAPFMTAGAAFAGGDNAYGTQSTSTGGAAGTQDTVNFGTAPFMTAGSAFAGGDDAYVLQPSNCGGAGCTGTAGVATVDGFSQYLTLANFNSIGVNAYVGQPYTLPAPVAGTFNVDNFSTFLTLTSFNSNGKDLWLSQSTSPGSTAGIPAAIGATTVPMSDGNEATGTIDTNATDPFVLLMDGGSAASSYNVRSRVGNFNRVDIAPSTNSYTKAVDRTDCAGASCTYTEELQNFANWYSYYSTRLLMMKSASTLSFNDLDSKFRVGFDLLSHYGSGNIDLQVAQFVNTGGETANQRTNWWSKLTTATTSGSTPLRSEINKIGKYYAGKLTSSAAVPAVPEVKSVGSITITAAKSGGAVNSIQIEGIEILGAAVTLTNTECTATGTPKICSGTSNYLAAANLVKAQIDTWLAAHPAQTQYVVTTSSSGSGTTAKGIVTLTAPAGLGAAPNGDHFTFTKSASNITLANADFSGGKDPVAAIPATVIEPMQYSCQQNYTLLVTDGYWNSDTYSALKQLDGTTQIGSQDNVLYDVNTAPNGAIRGQYDGEDYYNNLIATATAPYNTTYSIACDDDTKYSTCGTLADVAMYYYKTDLRDSSLSNTVSGATGLDVATNNVFVNGVDSNSKQHMVFFGMALGAPGTLRYRADYLTAQSGDYYDIVQGTKQWPAPKVNDPATIDDLWHATVNGHGKYFSARDPVSASAGLKEALSSITAQVGSAAAAATSNLKPVSGDNYAYVASYETVTWVGDVQARTINLVTGAVDDGLDANNNSTCGLPLDSNGQGCLWSAQTLLDTKSLASRRVYIAPATGSSGDAMRLFTYGNLTGTTASGEKSYFEPNTLNQYASILASYGSGKVNATNLVKFLGGDRSQEANGVSGQDQIWRKREHVLGDIVSTQPAFVKKPSFTYLDPGYTDYKNSSASSRPGMLYIAANDGMLHAFDSTSGDEQWAFIPKEVLPVMSVLADSNYQHRYFVDGQISVGDVNFGHGTNDWHTILVVGLGGGGKEYFALDVTDPTAPVFLWEISNNTSGFDKLGYTFGNASINKLPNGQWAVFFSSGYNNADGHGYLYAVNPETGAMKTGFPMSSATEGDNGTVASPSNLGKMSAWVTDVRTDNTAGFFYGGDMNGNVWRFDLDPNTTGHSDKSVFKLAELQNASGQVQPITTRLELTEVGATHVIFASTGQYLGKTDPVILDQQSLYAIKDTLGDSNLGAPGTPQATWHPRDDVKVSTMTYNSLPNGTHLFLSRSIVNTTDSKGNAVRTICDTAALDTSTGTCGAGAAMDFGVYGGWYADFPDSGERSNVDMNLTLGTLTIPTNVPNTSACSSGGYSWINYVDFKTGLAVAAQNASNDQPIMGVKVEGALTVGINVVQLPGGSLAGIVTTSDYRNVTVSPAFNKEEFTGHRDLWRELQVY